MQKRSALFMALGILFTAAVLGGISQSGEDLFQKALRLERNEGKLTEAIELYKTIVKQFPGNREVAAEAQFHIGLCYEQLGNLEAQNAYQTVIENYGEQKNVVAKARDRISKLERLGQKSEEPEGIRIKQIWKKPYTDSLGTVSSDGRFYAHVYWGEGDVAIHDLASGEDRILTHDADLATGFAMEPTFSKDGKRIAYSWWNTDHTYDLFLVDVENPKPRKLYRREGEHVYPVAWLSDDELIFQRMTYETKVLQVCSLSVSSGAIHVLKTMGRGQIPQFSCSSDGKFIAYNFANETDNGNFDINILAVDGSGETVLVRHPANDGVLGWVPGRREFLFISDRSGTFDVWAIPVDEGKPSGPARRIYTGIGRVEPVGFAQNGDCFFGFNRRNFNVYLAPFNTETGELLEKSGKTVFGSNLGVKWSPDGQYLAYCKENAWSKNPLQLVIQDLKTGEERTLADNLVAMKHSWSPDGNSILAIGFEKSASTRGAGIYRVDVRSGQAAQILNLLDYKDTINPPGDDAFPLSDVEWSADGRSFFYLFFTDRLVKRDLASGEEKTLYNSSRFDRSVLNRSPDGRNLLFAIRSPEDKKSHLYTMPIDGGEEKELCTAQEANYIEMGMWSPDGKYVYFTERQEGTSLWRVSAEGGMPQKVWQSKNRAEFYDIHPGGKQLAFAVHERELEIRVIENLVQELDKINKTEK